MWFLQNVCTMLARAKTVSSISRTVEDRKIVYHFTDLSSCSQTFFCFCKTWFEFWSSHSGEHRYNSWRVKIQNENNSENRPPRTVARCFTNVFQYTERWCERKCGWSVGNLRFRPISTTPPLCAWGNTPEAKSWKAKELESQGAGKQSFAARKARPGGTRFTFAFWPFFFASFLSNSAAIFAAKLHFSLRTPVNNFEAISARIWLPPDHKT